MLLISIHLQSVKAAATMTRFLIGTSQSQASVMPQRVKRIEAPLADPFGRLLERDDSRRVDTGVTLPS